MAKKAAVNGTHVLEDVVPVRKKKRRGEAREPSFKLTRKMMLDPDPVKRRAAHTAFMLENARQFNREFPDESAGVSGLMGAQTIGIYVPSIVMQYQLQCNVLPLSRLYAVVGKEGSFKSAFATEIGRWFSKYNGWGTVFEAESKWSDKFSRSIQGYDYPSLTVIGCYSQDDWQRKMQHEIRKLTRAMGGYNGKPGHGRYVPYLFVLDSLSGRDAAETMERIEKKGSPTRAFSEEARKNTQYFRKITADIAKEPMSILVVNHLKEGKDERGFTERRKPGGFHVGFNVSVEWQMDRLGRRRIVGDETLMDLSIKCYKNALGDTSRSVPVSVHWRYDPDPDHPGELRQVTYFDWYEALPRLIFMLAEEGTMGKDAIKATGLVKVNNNSCYSPALGFNSTKAMSFQEMGGKISQNKELSKRLLEIFQVQKHRPLLPLVDYRVQRAGIQRELDRELSRQIELLK